MEQGSVSQTGVLQTIPARSGMAVEFKKGQSIKIINTHGTQVVDTWAFAAAAAETRADEYMSMSHSRAATLHICPVVGDRLVSNLRRPMLTLEQDTSPGVHDTLMAACDRARYEGLGVVGGHHANCRDNLHRALSRLGRGRPVGDDDDDDDRHTPDPLNLFMNVPVSPTGGLAFERPASRPGQFVKFRAEMDCVVAMSACPQDLVQVNAMAPVEAHFVVED
jgi:uncharacterized protein YcgI (DUF1989 family)